MIDLMIYHFCDTAHGSSLWHFSMLNTSYDKVLEGIGPNFSVINSHWTICLVIDMVCNVVPMKLLFDRSEAMGRMEHCSQGCHGQGKSGKFQSFSESENFVASQGILSFFFIKVREKSGNFVCCPYRCIFFIVWRMIYELGQNLRQWPHSISFAKWFFSLFAFMFCTSLAQDIKNFHDVENVLLCWPIFKTTMLKHLLMNNVICGLNILQKITTGYISRQWLEFVLAVREISGKSQGIFFCEPRGNPGSVWQDSRLCDCALHTSWLALYKRWF